MRSPTAVILDHATRRPDLLFFYETDGAKLVVKLDYSVKKKGTVNLLRSGRFMDEDAMRSVRGNLRSGVYTLLEGSL